MISRRLCRGDVVLATIPFTDLTSSKVRPALIISDGIIGQEVVLAGISSVVRAGQFDSDVLLDSQHPEFAATGLLRTSVIRTHLLVTVKERIAARVLGRLSADWLAVVDQRLSEVLGLSRS